LVSLNWQSKDSMVKYDLTFTRAIVAADV